MNTRREVWTAQHGEIPRGWLVYTLNGNPSDCREENLAAIPRKPANVGQVIAPFEERIRNLERLLKESQEKTNDNDSKSMW